MKNNSNLTFIARLHPTCPPFSSFAKYSLEKMLKSYIVSNAGTQSYRMLLLIKIVRFLFDNHVWCNLSAIGCP